MIYYRSLLLNTIVLNKKPCAIESVYNTIMLTELMLPLTGNAYCKARNLVNNKLEVAHCDCQRRLFDDLFTGSKRQFRKYIRSMR